MKRHIEAEIEVLKNRVLYMGSIVEEMVHLASKIYVERDEHLCEQIFNREEVINQLQIEIDEKAVRILALYQPEASDLRTILASMKINTELERIADQTVNIAQTSAYHLLKETPVPIFSEIPRMAELAQKMFKESLNAYSKRDVWIAQNLLEQDDEEDALKTKVIHDVLGLILKYPRQSKQFFDLVLIAKNFEKIADQVTNIAEDVIFMVLGKDIRHPTKKENETEVLPK
jgi:phosphate transport system protein